jgi:hypothetical protein
MPVPGPITPADIEHRFTNHPPATPEVGELLDEVTARCIDFGSWLAGVIPPSREASLAVTSLEQTSMWAKAGIARNQANST